MCKSVYIHAYYVSCVVVGGERNRGCAISRSHRRANHLWVFGLHTSHILPVSICTMIPYFIFSQLFCCCCCPVPLYIGALQEPMRKVLHKKNGDNKNYKKWDQRERKRKRSLQTGSLARPKKRRASSCLSFSRYPYSAVAIIISIFRLTLEDLPPTVYCVYALYTSLSLSILLYILFSISSKNMKDRPFYLFTFFLRCR